MKKALQWLFIACLCIGIAACKPKNNFPIEQEKDTFSLGYEDKVSYIEPSKDDIEVTYTNLLEQITGPLNGIFQSKYAKGALEFFNLDNKISIQIEISMDTLKQLDEDYSLGNKESYRKCNINISFCNLRFHYKDVGIRQKGNSSRGNILDKEDTIQLRHYKLSFSETFDDEFTKEPEVWEDIQAKEYRENRTFFGLEKLILRWNRNKDGTYLREYYANEVYRNSSVLAPHANLASLSMKIGDKEEALGVYLALEDISKDFMKRNLVSASAGGDLYKLGWTSVGAKLDSKDAKLFGVEKQVLENGKYKQIGYPYDLKSNKKKSKHEDILSFIDKLLSTSTQEFDQFLKNSCVYDSVISYLAVSYLLGDPDDLRGNFNNTYLYFTKDTSQALFIPTDQDRPLGSTGGTGNPTRHHGAYNEPFDEQTGYAKNDMPFFEKSILMGGNQQIKKEYIKKIESVLAAGWLDFKTFEAYYNKALKYQQDTALGKSVSGKRIPFSLTEETKVESEGNLSIELYFTKKKETFLKKDWLKELAEEITYAPYYLRGEMNDWNGINKTFQFKLEDNIPTLIYELQSTQAFKIASADWQMEWNYSNLQDASNFDSVGKEQNIRTKTTGLYKLQIIDNKLWITKL